MGLFHDGPLKRSQVVDQLASNVLGIFMVVSQEVYVHPQVLWVPSISASRSSCEGELI